MVTLWTWDLLKAIRAGGEKWSSPVSRVLISSWSSGLRDRCQILQVNGRIGVEGQMLGRKCFQNSLKEVWWVEAHLKCMFTNTYSLGNKEKELEVVCRCRAMMLLHLEQSLLCLIFSPLKLIRSAFRPSEFLWLTINAGWWVVVED